MITKAYHPFRGVGLLIVLVRLSTRYLLGHRERAIEEFRYMNKIAINKESRTESLVGIYLVFVGFILQGAGALFWAVDEFMTVNSPTK